ncbi:MAG: phosphoribosylformylglycinamidine synthase subunit PurS [Chloroflexi bacterium]|nr:MAG: phosphoribosylformylglycinamidine synthase subunit PurS [Chloroflexota bacterium]
MARRRGVGLVRWIAEVHVQLRPGIADPEGLTVAGGLRALGFATVSEVRSGKLAAGEPGHGDGDLGAACR